MKHHAILRWLAILFAFAFIAASCGDDSADEPAADEPAADEPAADEPAADEPAADEPAADEPAADEPATDEPAADEPAADEPRYGGTLTVAWPAESVGLDPALFFSTVDIMQSLTWYENLLIVTADLSRKPLLATSWEPNDDFTSWTFNLRQGVTFHHGKEFKAEDVISTYNRLRDPELGSAAFPLLEDLVDIVALDDHTVRFDLANPNSLFPDITAMHYMRIVPSDIPVERLTLEAFGTGPFMITEHLPLERTVVVRNPDYWDEGRPYLDEVVYLLIAEETTREQALKNGDVDLLFAMNPQSAASIEDHPDTTVLVPRHPGGSQMQLDMNNTTPPFDNKLIRQAMQAATDRESIVQAAGVGFAEVAYDYPVPFNDPFFAKDLTLPTYDPELARSLLEQAGYPDGIDVVLQTSDVGSGYIDMAVAFAEGAAAAGIQVEVERVPPSQYWNGFAVEPLFTVAWFIEPNSDIILTSQLFSTSTVNDAHYNNPTIDELIIKARGQDGEEQRATYAEIQQIIMDDVPNLGIMTLPHLVGARNHVRFDPHPLNWLPVSLTDAWLAN